MTGQEASNQDTEKDSAHRISDSGYIVVATLLSAVWVLGTIFNVICLSVFTIHRKLRSPTNMFVMSLNLCDLCMSFVGTFMAMTSAWRKEWLYGHPGCVFEGFAVYFLGLTSVYLLSAISLDRYIVIARPLIGPRITHKVAGASISACWLGGFLWASFPLLGWNEYVLEGAGISCSVMWESSNPVYSSYIFTIFVFVFLLPLIVMAFSYYHVYMTVRTISKNPNWKNNSRVARRNLRVEKKMAKTIAFMLGAYLVCWMPYAILSFVVVFQGSDVVSKEIATYPAVLAKCQGLINPILYVATNKQFRQAFFDVIPNARLRAFLQKKEEESSDSDNNDNGNTRNRDFSGSDTAPRTGIEPRTSALAKSSVRSTRSHNAVHPDTSERVMEVSTVTERLDSPDAVLGRSDSAHAFYRPFRAGVSDNRRRSERWENDGGQRGVTGWFGDVGISEFWPFGWWACSALLN